jgi:hypothetical protein
VLAPELNNDGVVTFQDACDRTVIGDGFQQIVLGPVGGDLTINDSEIVGARTVVTTSVNGVSTQLDRILTAPATGGTTIRLREEDTPFVGLHEPRINNNGSFSFFGSYAGTSDDGIYRLDPGGMVTTMLDPTTLTPFGPAYASGRHDINDIGQVALLANFLTISGSAVFRSDGVNLTTISDRFSAAGFPSINNSGVVAFIDNTQRVVTGDGGPHRVIATSGTTLPFRQFLQASINDSDNVAFLAVLGTNIHGIFTGPDPVANKVVQTGDTLNIVQGGFKIEPSNGQGQVVNMSPSGINDLGQIAFTVWGTADNRASRAVVRADPPGSTPQNPILPPSTLAPWRFGLSFGVAARSRARRFTYIDPHIAVGYRFAILHGGPSKFSSVIVPAALPKGDASFEISFAGQMAPLEAGTAFDFTTTVPGGVSEFTISGIDETEMLEPDNPVAFVTGIAFTGEFVGTVEMAPLSEDNGDTEAPIIQAPAGITINATSASGATVTYAVSATDNSDPNPTVSCSPSSGSTFRIGVTAVRCTATDQSGNTGSAGFNVSVVFQFSGFFSPVDNPPAVNQAKAGASLPLKFGLGGDMGFNILAAGSPSSQATVCDSSATVSPVEETASPGGSALSYNSLLNQYTFVWKTESAWANTCRRLFVSLADGSVHVAEFQFRR